jgi:MYXO-CTERM domain-containing protein
MNCCPIRCSRYVAVSTFLAALAFGPRRADALPTGIASSNFPNINTGCNGCHTNLDGTAVPPAVALSASATSLTPGQQITLTFVVTSMNAPAQHAAGFNIRSSQPGTSNPPGTFAVGGAASTGTRTIAGVAEMTHSVPKENDGSNQATFTALWTPNNGVSGDVTFTAWGNSVNLNASNQGDRAATTTFVVNICTPSNWYTDADHDGYGAGVPTSACTQPAGTVADNTDCNDASDAIHPGATEVCNGADDNCNGSVDEGVTSTFYRDQDGDGYGNPAISTAACAAPTGYVVDATDCNDGAVSIHPGATEVCNGIDDNCAGGIDEGLPTSTFYQDHDGDGFGNPNVSKVACNAEQAGAGYVTDHTDCDDTSADIHPGATEVCGNGKDDNCNGIVDTDAPSTSTFYRDVDGDGYGAATSGTTTACAPPAGYVSNNTDCDDSNAAIHPGAAEVCNGKDDNCAAGIDEELGSLTCGEGACKTTVTACVGGVPQTCTPVCPDAGPDATPDAAADVPVVNDVGTPVVDGPPPEVSVVDAPRDVASGDAGLPGVDGPSGADAPATDATVDRSAGDGSASEDATSGATPDARGDATKLDARVADAPSNPGANEDTGGAGDSGCSCRVGSGTHVGASSLGGLLVAVALLRRRRRKAA